MGYLRVVALLLPVVWLAACPSQAQHRFDIPALDPLADITVPDPQPNTAPQYLGRDPWRITRPQSPQPPAPQQAPANDVSPWEACVRAPDASAALAYCTEFAQDEDQPAARRAEAFLARARAHEVQNQTVAAIADLTAALELNPKWATAFHRRGVLWTHERNFDQAIKDFSAALALSPRSLEFFVARGVAYRGKKDSARSIADFDRALAINPRSELAYYERGLTKLDARDYAGATADLEKALELNPRLALAQFALGNVQYAQRNIKAAIVSYDKAVRLDPSIEYYVSNARGVAKFEIGDCNGAIDDFSRALAINERSPGTFRNRGTCLVKRGKFEDAIIDFTRAIYITPDSADLFAERGSAFLYNRDLVTARRDINHALKLDAKNAAALRARARLRLIEHDLPGAFTDLNASLSHKFSDDALSERIWFHIVANDLDQARQDISDVLARNPADPSALFARGYLKIKAGDQISGKQDMVEAVQRDHDLVPRLEFYGLKF